MLRVEASRRAVDLEAYRGSYADARHVTRELAEPCLVYLDGEAAPSVAYVELEERLPEAIAALRKVAHFDTGARTAGMPSESRTFGYAPKLTVRGQETCRESSLAGAAPAQHDAIAGLAEVVERHYRELNPGLYAQHEQIVDRVLAEWRLGGGVFTSGIINRNSKLPYHYDRGNFAHCWSNMVVFKRSCIGGDLVCPEIDLCFRLRDHSLLMFDGQAILHGVSPFRLSRRDGYRYSVVFYSLKQMWRCETREDALGLNQRRRTERERARFS